MIWAFFGILSTLFRAAFAESNRILKADTWQLNFWHALFGLLLLLPFTAGVEWSLNPYVYFTAVLASFVITAGALLQLSLSNLKTARVTSMHIPCEAIVAFVLWFILMPLQYKNFIRNPEMTLMVGLGFVLLTIGLARVRRNDMGWKGLLAIIPGGLTFGGIAVLVKALIVPADLPDAAFVFVFITYAVMTLTMAIILLIRRKAREELVDTTLVRAGLTTGILSAATFLCFVYSLAYSDNPAYPVLLASLVPVWLLLYHKAKRIDDQAKPVPALLIVAGAVLLIVAGFV